MIKKYTVFALAFIAISISSLYAANNPNVAENPCTETGTITFRIPDSIALAKPSEKPQHPAVSTILLAVGIKCMRIPGIKQIVALPFGIGCTVYGVNELRKHQDVAKALDNATKKVKSTVTLPAMMAIFNQCKDKVKAFCTTSESSDITPPQASELESRTMLLPAVKPIKFPAVLSPESAPTAARQSAPQHGNGPRSSSR